MSRVSAGLLEAQPVKPILATRYSSINPSRLPTCTRRETGRSETAMNASVAAWWARGIFINRATTAQRVARRRCSKVLFILLVVHEG